MAESNWRGEFFARHCERFQRGDWPGPSSGFWSDWQRKLVKAGIRKDEAHAASEAMFDAGEIPPHVDRHPDALEAKVRGTWKATRAPAAAASPVAPDEDTSAWNAAAAEHWASLTDDERDAWRGMVRKRCSFLARSAKALDLMASAWSYDPSWIISLPPKHDPAPLRGPRRVFDALPVPSPKPKG